MPFSTGKRARRLLILMLAACLIQAGALPALAASTSEQLVADLKAIYLAPPKIDAGKLALGTLAALALQTQDSAVKSLVQTGVRSEATDRLMPVITDLGSITGIAVVGLVALKDHETGYLAANSMIYAGLTVHALKLALGKSRPWKAGSPGYHPFSLALGNDSMPSGHTANAFAIATVLAHQYPRYKWWFYGAASAVGISRMYLNAHWASDVLAGGAIGVWSANQVLGRSSLFEIRKEF